MRSLLGHEVSANRWAVMLAATVLVAAPDFCRAEVGDVPLVLTVRGPDIEPGSCSFWPALSFATHLGLRPAASGELAWQALLRQRGSQVFAEPHSPTGRVVTKKKATGGDPCETAIQLLAILLSAHVPTFGLAVEPPAPARRRPTRAEPADPRPVALAGKTLPLVLFALEGMSGKEIAGLLQIPEATVWTRLHGARRNLLAELETEPGPVSIEEMLG